MSSLYIHIPFCRSKCHYCTFNSFPGMDSFFQRYLDALKGELVTKSDGSSPLSTLFIGGGTPTVVGGSRLAEIVSTARRCYGFTENAEISVEANPESVSVEEAELLLGAGVNRVSLGVQSFNDNELGALGRIHSADRAEKAVATLRAAGFDNISLDLMTAIPLQGEKSWRQSLERALELLPSHISIYQLMIEDGSAFAINFDELETQLPSEEEACRIDKITLELCAASGFERYEISNYARPGRRCQHNLVYWRNEEYYGCGAGAVSYEDGVRRKNESDPLQYSLRQEKGEKLFVEEERLDDEAAFRETVIMGLRLIEGLSRPVLVSRYGLDPVDYYSLTLVRLREQGLVDWNNEHLFLTQRGLQLANVVMAELV
ncbi:MAG: radical SAM family heme chaperone HemW [Thermodesulfobacteriota bacterium]